MWPNEAKYFIQLQVVLSESYGKGDRSTGVGSKPHYYLGLISTLASTHYREEGKQRRWQAGAFTHPQRQTWHAIQHRGVFLAAGGKAGAEWDNSASGRLLWRPRYIGGLITTSSLLCLWYTIPTPFPPPLPPSVALWQPTVITMLAIFTHEKAEAKDQST